MAKKKCRECKAELRDDHDLFIKPRVEQAKKLFPTDKKDKETDVCQRCFLAKAGASGIRLTAPEAWG